MYQKVRVLNFYPHKNVKHDTGTGRYVKGRILINFASL